MKYSTILISLLSLLNIGLIKCEDKYIITKMIVPHKVYFATYGDEKRVVKILKDKMEGELMKPNGKQSKFVAKVLYNDKCSNLDIKIEIAGMIWNDAIDGMICLIIPFYEGGDLLVYAKENPDVVTQFTGIWIEQILMGLSTLHENNVLHNDIKELNIFVTKDKDVVIGDLDGGEVGVDGKGKGTTFTPAYVSPERAKVIMKREHAKIEHIDTDIGYA
eukprot:GHVR01075574.1.p1 GENE.GHVR01075574.1~~GHVR01075574.1.p1  ORF type:complete len:218 (+),score=43.04 GHVR01075574.1:102-755(+)